MKIRIAVRPPDMYFAMWKLEVCTDIDTVKEIVAFCEMTFGSLSKTLDCDEFRTPWEREDGTKWSMGLLSYLDPPWLELYFRDKEDVAVFKLNYGEYFHSYK